MVTIITKPPDMKRILLVANKNWEAEGALSALLSATVRPGHTAGACQATSVNGLINNKEENNGQAT
jgi:hypothetical protein